MIQHITEDLCVEAIVKLCTNRSHVLYDLCDALQHQIYGRIVEAVARGADDGGVLAGVRDFVASQAPQNFAAALQRSGVTPPALGTGYVVFFTYSALLGIFAVLLSLAVERRQRPPAPSAPGVTKLAKEP